MHAEILATGSELLSPDRSDTNSLWLTARLDDIGIPVRRKTIVGDHGPDLQEAIAQALGRAELVICTGGLGPTQDDVTREAAAQATGCFLRSDPVIEEGLRRRFAERGLEMPSNNLRQAMVPEGARCLPNRLGTAPGILLETHGRWLALLPGPPREMQPMFLEELLPALRRHAGPLRMARRVLKVYGLTESGLDERIAPLARAFPEVEVTVNFSPLDLELRLAARGSGSQPEEGLESFCSRLREDLGSHLFSEAGESLEQVVARILRARGLDLALGEVASGGLLAARLSQVGAPLRRALLVPSPPSRGEPAGSTLLPWPADLPSARAAASRWRRETGAALALVVGPGRGSGQQARVPVALSHAEGTNAQELRLMAGPLLSTRASQGGLDLIRLGLARAPQD